MQQERPILTRTCPICGRLLSQGNASIDHILPKRLGGSDDVSNLRYICNACNAKKADKYNPVFEYYYKLVKASHSDKYELGRNIDYILRNMTDEELGVIESEIDAADYSFEYAKSYMTMNKSMMNGYMYVSENFYTPSKDERLSSVMEKNISSLEGYDISKEEKERIGDAVFSFDKEFPIDDFRKVLIKYSEEYGEGSYYVYLDEEGRLVIY